MYFVLSDYLYSGLSAIVGANMFFAPSLVLIFMN
jgi:hypothetical protein